MTDKEPTPTPPGNSNAGSGVTTAPPVTTPLETAFYMMDKLIEAAQANPAMREKFKAVFNTPSGGSMAPENGPGDGLGDARGEGIEEGEMDVPPGPYTGGDLEYIEELEQRQAQLVAENEAMRQTLSTINTQRTGQNPPQHPKVATDTDAPNAVPDELQEDPQQEKHLRPAAFLPWQERRERSCARMQGCGVSMEGLKSTERQPRTRRPTSKLLEAQAVQAEAAGALGTEFWERLRPQVVESSSEFAACMYATWMHASSPLPQPHCAYYT
ncbi:hypothetical protein QJQ45_004384 [Haematococcus lacustris]|nr:hypothetical protein QJQ45_004384 [Haematococcus lacustris]